MVQQTQTMTRAPLARLHDCGNVLVNQYGNDCVELNDDGDEITVTIPDHDHHVVIRSIVEDNDLSIVQNGLEYTITV